MNKVFGKDKPEKRVIAARIEHSTCESKKNTIDLSTMSPDHQVDEQLNLAVLSISTDPQSLPQLRCFLLLYCFICSAKTTGQHVVNTAN